MGLAALIKVLLGYGLLVIGISGLLYSSGNTTYIIFSLVMIGIGGTILKRGDRKAQNRAFFRDRDEWEEEKRRKRDDR